MLVGAKGAVRWRLTEPGALPMNPTGVLLALFIYLKSFFLVGHG